MSNARRKARAVVVALALIPAATLVGTGAPAVADAPNCVKWTGNVTRIIADANQRIAKVSQKKFRQWFDLPKRGGKLEYYDAWVDADPTVNRPRRGKQLGDVQVVYGVSNNKFSVSVVYRYLKGCRNGIRKVDDTPMGSFGFPNRPKVGLNQAIRLTKQWRKENPDLDGYRLGGAQLQKADAAPPWTGRKRWVVTFENPGFFDEQLLVYMNGKVKKAQP